jgi:molecular chaperone GrpE
MEENKINPEEGCEAEKDAAANAKKEKKSDKKELLAKIEKLEADIKEKDDKYLRMAAEYDNFRRRSREEKEATYESALADTVAELLPIIDNLERASLYEDGEKVKEGLVMTAKSAISAFEKLGVEEFGKVGETFDPALHNAVLHVEDESLGEGEIVEVFQKGYKKGKHIIRFAMVKTAN